MVWQNGAYMLGFLVVWLVLDGIIHAAHKRKGNSKKKK